MPAAPAVSDGRAVGWTSPVAIVAGLVAVAAWASLWLAVDMAGAGTMGMAAAAWIFGWALMVGAMMGPSSLWFVRAVAPSQSAGAELAVAHVAVWVLVGVAAYGVAVLTDVLGRHAAGALPPVAGSALVAAGLDQPTAVIERCLTRCRAPDNFAKAIGEVYGVHTARVDISHERRRRRIDVRGTIEMAKREPVAVAEAISCGIPGHEHPGEDLIAETLQVDSGPLQFAFSGRCGFASEFAYRA